MKPAVAIPRPYTASVTSTRALSPKIILAQLHPATAVPYTAGQYASWLIGEYRRPLSFATPAGYPYLEFVVDTSPGGVASQFVTALKPGDTVTVLAPYGRFVVDKTAGRPYLFVATGAGIGPIRAQILEVLAEHPAASATLIFGNQDEHYFFFDDEFTELAHLHPNFTFIPTCSTPSAQWAGERGRVTAVIPRRIDTLPQWEVYVCGSPAMVRDTTAVLTTSGVPKAQIHAEQFT